MTKKLFDEYEEIYRIEVINIRLNELRQKGAVLKKIGKPTKNGTRATFIKAQSAEEIEREIQKIVEDSEKLGLEFKGEKEK